jgi:hypothetical protein
MSFFKPAGGSERAESGSQSFVRPDRSATKGDRTAVIRVDEPEYPEFRKQGITLSRRGKVGLTNAVVIERVPRGCLLKVKGGWFDLDGYWCVPKADRRVEVRRGASQKINALLTPAQRKMLDIARLRARERGVR